MDLCNAFSFAWSAPSASAAGLATFNDCSPSVTPDVDVYNIDLFENPSSTFAALRALGKRVVCYFSAGSYEDGRPDSRDFEKGDLGKELEGWPGEYWVDTNSEKTNRNGLGLTSADSIDFITFLAYEARKQGLAMGLKNGGSVLKAVLPVIDFSVNEECAAYDECDLYKAVTDAGKPVFHIEYPATTRKGVDDKDARRACKAKGAGKFSTVMKALDLNGWVQYCDGDEYTTYEDKGKASL
ncbi:hypothetical protein ACHAQH_005909 [Verticillium albo-atrum]